MTLPAADAVAEAVAAHPLPFRVLAFALGAGLGSFLHACAWRVPLGTGIVHPPSRCPSCGRPLAWHDNLPILGWLVLRGRSRCCAVPIPAGYVLAEVLAGLACLGLFMTHAERGDLAGFAASTAVFCWLLALAIIDLRHRILPDALVAPVLLGLIGWAFAAMPPAGGRMAAVSLCCGLVLAAFLPWILLLAGLGLVRLACGSDREERAEAALGRARLMDRASGLPTARAWIVVALAAAGLVLLWGRGRGDPGWILAASGCLAAGGLPWLSGRIVGALVRQEAIGLGDVKLAACLGFLLGAWQAFLALGIASLLGGLVGAVLLLVHGERRIPFGPFLAAGGFAAWEWGDRLTALVLRAGP